MSFPIHGHIVAIPDRIFLRKLRFSLFEILNLKMGQTDEAIARGFGYKSRAALLHSLSKEAPLNVTIHENHFWERVREFGGFIIPQLFLNKIIEICGVENKTTEIKNAIFASEDDVDDLFESAESLRSEISEYLESANSINDIVYSNNDIQDISLDDLPYGEEEVRLRDAPDELSDILDSLKDDNITEELFKDLEEKVNDWRDTFDDCARIPDETNSSEYYDYEDEEYDEDEDEDEDED